MNNYYDAAGTKDQQNRITSELKQNACIKIINNDHSVWGIVKEDLLRRSTNLSIFSFSLCTYFFVSQSIDSSTLVCI